MVMQKINTTFVSPNLWKDGQLKNRKKMDKLKKVTLNGVCSEYGS
jgi:hypothetical protein